MKMPEEIKQGLEYCGHAISCFDCPYFDGDDCEEALEDDALALIQQLEAQVPKWISIEEQMPENCDDVLIFTNQGISMGYYDIYFGDWVDYVCTDSTHVTHWMPLPEPPKED